MTAIFHRAAIAATMAQQLIRPGPLEEGYRSGLLLSGLRRTGKTTYLKQDLMPALEAEGALVLYVDLWSDTQASTSHLLHSAVRSLLADVAQPGSRILAKLNAVKGINLGALGFSFGMSLERVGMPDGITLAAAFTELVDKAGTDVVLIIDEVQQAIGSEEGRQTLIALKAARDAINLRRDTRNHFIFIGTGSHKSLVNELVVRKNQGFQGATAVNYPLLDADYVDFLLNRLKAAGIQPLPDRAATLRAFRTLGHRPEELIRTLQQLRHTLPAGMSPNDLLQPLAEAVRNLAADSELMQVDQLGLLARAVFDQIAQSTPDTTRLFTAAAAEHYSAQLGREVRVEEIQPVVNALLAANLIMRRGHGQYCVTDPFVQEVWTERMGEQLLPSPSAPSGSS